MIRFTRPTLCTIIVIWSITLPAVFMALHASSCSQILGKPTLIRVIWAKIVLRAITKAVLNCRPTRALTLVIYMNVGVMADTTLMWMTITSFMKF